MSFRIGSISVIAMLLLLAAWTTPVEAQSYYATGHAPYAGAGYGGYYGSYHSATAAEGYLRGRAALVQAYGVASLYYAQALEQREVARSRYMDNQLAVLAHYDEIRAARKEREQRRLAERVRRRQIVQTAAAEQKATQRAAIDWPAELRSERYEPTRTQIEALAHFHARLGNDAGDATGLAFRHAVRQLANQVMADEEADRLSDEQSVVVRQFVRGLAADVLHANTLRPDPSSLAMNASHRR